MKNIYARKVFLIFITAVLLIMQGCISSNMAPVTIAVNLPPELRSSSSDLSRSGVGEIPSGSGITSLRLRITGAGMTTITENILLSAVSVTVIVPVGTARNFLMEALDSSGTVIYRGATTVDLSGGDITLSISMSAVNNYYAFWNDTWTSSVSGGNVNYTATQSATPDTAAKKLNIVYNNNGAGGGSGVPLQTWTFSATASRDGEIHFNWNITGMHAWASATLKMEFFYGATTVEIKPQTTVNGAFDFTSSAAVTAALVSGQTYGIRIYGSNSDSNSLVSGSASLY